MSFDTHTADRGRLATKEDLTHIATKADLYQVALGMTVANAAILFGLLKLVGTAGP